MFVKRNTNGRTQHRRESLSVSQTVRFAVDITGRNEKDAAAKTSSDEDELGDKFWLPPPGQKPLQVEIECSCLALSEINTLDLSAQVKFNISLTWIDERFISNSIESTSSLPGNLWGPDIHLTNAMTGFTITYTSFACIDPSLGRMKRTIQFHGGVRNPMDLKNFPFDSDDLELAFNTYSSWRLLDCSKRGNDPTNRIYEVRAASKKRFFKMDCPQDINEFHLTGWTFTITNPDKSSKFNSEIRPTDFLFKFYIIRRHSFYVWRIFLPVWLFVLTSFVVFSFELNDTSGRFEYLACVLLANVGYVYILQDSIPKVPFYTSVDKVIFLSLLTIVITIFSSRIIASIYIRNQEWGVVCNWTFACSIQFSYWILNCVFVIPPYMEARKKSDLGSKFNMVNFKSANSISLNNKIRRGYLRGPSFDFGE